jgi:hypothetical protein
MPQLRHAQFVRGLAALLFVAALVALIGVLPDGAGGARRTLAAPANPRAVALGARQPMTEPTSTPTIADVTPSAMATDAPTDTPTARPTVPPRPVFMPLLVRDPACRPDVSYADVVFVEDVSNYMGRIHDGETSSALSNHYMKQMAGLMDLNHTRIGLVRFTDLIWVEQGLTSNRSLFLKAVDTTPRHVADKARMDVGLRTARDMLLSGASTPGNGKVIIFISELQAKSVPWDKVAGCVQKHGEECAVLAAATEVKAQGITIYLWATGNSADGGQMLWGSLATDKSKRFLDPTDADIATTFSQIEVVKPCPPGLSWPYPKSR